MIAERNPELVLLDVGLPSDLLLLARLESTDFPLDRRTVALNDLVDATVTGLQHEARGREVTLSTRIADTPL